MKRVIKFRAWIDGNLYYNHSVNIAVDGTIAYLTASGDWVTDLEGKVEVMQYTGLKDKNGKEIYEGDILQTGKYADWKSIVKYMPGGWYASLGDKVPGIPFTERSQPLASFLFEHYDWFIIGNIYENPEFTQ